MNDDSPKPILDFELIEKSIYIRFYNASDCEAYNIRTEFSKSIPGFKGTKKISSLNVFRNLRYMAPRKEFLIYVDEVASFYENLKIDSVNVHLEYRDSSGRMYKKDIEHNLLIYKDIPIIIKSN